MTHDHEWKIGDKCEMPGGAIGVVRYIEGAEACVFDPDCGLSIKPLAMLRPIPAKVKLPVGELHFWSEHGHKQALWDRKPNCPHHTITLHKYHLMEAFVELVRTRQIDKAVQGPEWYATGVTGIGTKRYPDWRTAVLDLRPDLAEALGGEG